ncbi:ribosome biogenesis GTPase YlqF [Aerococcus kribbianus]|uniref:Ribosome biogenesis GTPase A n=1 Tax=Aerococcus kribbianus TaxID=2999064 RepID=A0A9X3JE77_9LACT|nr:MULTISPECIES: ribosome biogenesis GTPase YlqF [unclassified Aerococcus]MCZ0716794.1 ribosome biogenesis GTPase YlqF [Aerococcus sp. YH-aer221]MCZ0725082.1 ribosome biogenesis GTPase YlqF [Aerococcus sp. YH-aer222]
MATIQWYPGHMAKAKKEVQENLKAVDVVIELRDARIPESSKNPMLEKIIQNKAHIIVLNKSDLADSRQTKAWQNALTNDTTSVMTLNSKNPKAMKQFKKSLYDHTQSLRDKWLQKGLKAKAIRLMIIGIPNVGKSTFINQFTKQKKANVGNKPGVTKGQQWIRIDKDFELLDTPGILWPKFEDKDVAMHLALTGAIKDTHFYKDDAALYALAFLLDYYPDYLSNKYPINPQDFHPPYPELLMTLTQKMGLLEDYERASERLLRDLKNGHLGPLSLDRIEDYYDLEGNADD